MAKSEQIVLAMRAVNYIYIFPSVLRCFKAKSEGIRIIN